MFKKHPKGFLYAILANTFERFAFYTMMTVLILFLMSKFRLESSQSGII
jgi:POT family proton-dependent oligopeptide transporter